MKKRIKEFFNEEIKQINKKDIIILIIILLIYSLISFYKLGDNYAPQTFYEAKKNEEIIIPLKNEDDIIRMKLYTGKDVGNIKLYISSNNIDYEFIEEYSPYWTFAWENYRVAKKAKYIKLEILEDTSIGEIAFYNNSKEYINVDLLNDKDKSLFDEKEVIPDKKSYMNSSYFDEYYFARSAYEYVNGYKTNEWTHPPLGKIIEAIPIYITHKMTPFNYRLMGNISGILLVGVMYIFGAILFKKRKYAIYSSLLMFLDTFHFAQTRIGTVDSHLVLFITLGIMFMYLFITKEKIKYLITSGIFFFLSISVKWTGLYGGIALAIMYFIYLIKNKKINIKYITLGTMLFVILPIITYISIYLIFSNNYYKTNNIKNIILEQEKMYKFHSSNDLEHEYSSKWYTWMISYKPVWLHLSNKTQNTKETISGVGNIVIWYMGLIAIIYMMIKLIKKKDKTSFYILLPILSLWLPYAFIPRPMFLYHFFPVLPFYFLGVVYLFKNIENKLKIKYITPLYIILCAIFFIIYYPIVSGKEIENEKIAKLEIFDTWQFDGE